MGSTVSPKKGVGFKKMMLAYSDIDTQAIGTVPF